MSILHYCNKISINIQVGKKAVGACWFNIDTCSKLHKTSINNISQCGAGSAVPREGFDLSVIILASLLVFPMLGCRHFLLRL